MSKQARGQRGDATVREPLAGWKVSYSRFMDLDEGHLRLSVDFEEPDPHLPPESHLVARWWVVLSEGEWSRAAGPSLDRAMLRAEDCARRQVGAMVKALGGTVVWPANGGAS